MVRSSTVTTLFLVCTAVGGVLLLAQLVLGVFGGSTDDAGDASEPSDGLNLLSVRAISAAVAFFGIGGLAAVSLGWPGPFAALFAAMLGLGSMFGVAWLMRSMLKLQRDATVRIDHAIGQTATVYIPIPAAMSGIGKVTVSLSGRSVEYQAVTPDGQPLPTGSSVIVVDVREDDTLEVVPLPSVDGVL